MTRTSAGESVDLRALLAPIVGDERLATPGDAARIDGVLPRLVARPGSVDEVRAITRACAERGLTIVPAGRGRHLDVGAPPERCDLLVRLERLDAVLDHQPGDMTVTAAAGCTLASLEHVLARHAQWLPIDPAASEATTVGGLISANLSGPLRASQGTVRDLLLGVEVVDATGALVHGGGRVVKNVAGYDLPKLYVGALGSLGVLASATFKVRPRPEVERAVILPCVTAEDAAHLALSIRDAVEPFWLELARPWSALAAVSAETGRDGSSVAVAAGIAGFAAEVEDGVDRILRVANVRGARAEVVDDAARLRARLAAAPLEGSAAVLRAATLPTEVGSLLTAIEEAARAESATARIGAHFANGIVRIGIAEARAVAALVDRLRPQVAARGGHLVVERAVADVKSTLAGSAAIWGDGGSGLDLMRAVKSALDPCRTFSPGRLPGGI